MKVPAEPLVSCIIPTRNRPELVVRAIHSVLSQSYKKIEVIVIDDSTDSSTQQKLAQSGWPIRYCKNDKSMGASYSRNLGLIEAKGEVIAFLDDDDRWKPRKIEAQLRLMKKYPIVSCNCIADTGGKEIYISFPERVDYHDLLYYNFLGSCSFVIIDRGIMTDCFFDENLNCGQDWDMWLAVMAKNNLVEAANVGEFLVDYNQGPHPRITNKMDRIPALMSIYAKYQDKHDAFTNEMFGLYYMISSDDSQLVGLLRNLAIARKKKKGLPFFLKTMVQRLFRHIVIY